MPRIQDFKLPRFSSRDAPAIGPTETPEVAGKARTEPVDHLAEPRIVPFEVVCEQIRQRNEAKTAILREALQRTESSQQRFWGINE
jgi:hypothetical protein